MPTSSISHTVILDDEGKITRFLDALEKSEEWKRVHPIEANSLSASELWGFQTVGIGDPETFRIHPSDIRC